MAPLYPSKFSIATSYCRHAVSLPECDNDNVTSLKRRVVKYHVELN